MASINNLTAISVFRFLVIAFEVGMLVRILFDNLWKIHQGQFTSHSRKVAKILVFFAWVWSFLLALPPLLGWGSYSIEDNGMSCAPSWKNPSDYPYNMFLFIAGFFFPLSIISFSGVRILFIVRKVYQLFIFSTPNQQNLQHLAEIHDSSLREGAKIKESKIYNMVSASHHKSFAWMKYIKLLYLCTTRFIGKKIKKV